jgi:hypothetical protein
LLRADRVVPARSVVADSVRRRLPQVLRRQVRGSVVRLRRDQAALVVRLQVAKVQAVTAVLRRINSEAPPQGEGVQAASVVRLLKDQALKAVTVVRRRKVVAITARRPVKVVMVGRRKVVRRVKAATVVRRRKISISR